LNDFPENQLTEFRAVYTVKVNWGPNRLSSVVYAGLILREKIEITHFGPSVDLQSSLPQNDAPAIGGQSTC